MSDGLRSTRRKRLDGWWGYITLCALGVVLMSLFFWIGANP